MNVPQPAVHLRERNPRGLLPMQIVEVSENLEVLPEGLQTISLEVASK